LEVNSTGSIQDGSDGKAAGVEHVLIGRRLGAMPGPRSLLAFDGIRQGMGLFLASSERATVING